MSDERALSAVGGLVVVAALALGIAVIAVSFASAFKPREDARVVAVTLAGEPIVVEQAGHWKRFTITSAAPGLRWWDVLVHLDGVLVKCAEEPGALDGWRARHGERVLACTGPRQAPDAVIRAGDTLELWDGGADARAPLAGRLLELVDPERGAATWSTRLS